jgi:hypothetical protein
MTPKEAAAKCREWAEFSRSLIGNSDLRYGDPSFHYQDGLMTAYTAAANLIDQINVPQPWPPPEEMQEALAFCTSFNEKKWMNVGRKHQQAWTDMDLMIAYRPTHYLPMPPAPEVKG